jgi:hypothetical protein
MITNPTLVEPTKDDFRGSAATSLSPEVLSALDKARRINRKSRLAGLIVQPDVFGHKEWGTRLAEIVANSHLDETEHRQLMSLVEKETAYTSSVIGSTRVMYRQFKGLISDRWSEWRANRDRSALQSHPPAVTVVPEATPSYLDDEYPPSITSAISEPPPYTETAGQESAQTNTATAADTRYTNTHSRASRWWRVLTHQPWSENEPYVPGSR